MDNDKLKIKVTLNVNSDEYLAKLLRDATEFKECGEWESAIKALKEAKGRMLVSNVSYPVETWCKYPLYLQQAGKFDESMKEFAFLLDDLERRARKESYLDNPNIMGMNKMTFYHGIIENDGNTIRKKMALAQSREEKKQNKNQKQKS